MYIQGGSGGVFRANTPLEQLNSKEIFVSSVGLRHSTQSGLITILTRRISNPKGTCGKEYSKLSKLLPSTSLTGKDCHFSTNGVRDEFSPG